MPDENKPTYKPHHNDFWSMKGQVSDSEALNGGETVALALKDRNCSPHPAQRVAG
jgi:hypothetical protein